MDCCAKSVPSRFEGTPDFNIETATKEIDIFLRDFDPDKATRQELFMYQEYLEAERRGVQRNLDQIGLAERLYETRTGKARQIKAMKEDRKHIDRRLKELGVEETPKKANKPEQPKPAAKAKPKKKAVVKETSDEII